MTPASERLRELGIDLPEAPPPAAAYLPFVVEGGTVFTAGQIALRDGALLHKGRIGADLGMTEASECARQCAINILAQLRTAAGDIDDVDRIVKLTVFVASEPDFTDQHLVANAASELMAEIFGDRGRHARSAVGVAELPMGSPVEIEAIATLRR